MLPSWIFCTKTCSVGCRTAAFMVSVGCCPVLEEYAGEYVQGEHAERNKQSTRPRELVPVFIRAHGELKDDHRKGRHRRIAVWGPALGVEGSKENRSRLAADA